LNFLDTEEEDLREHFVDCGDICDVRVIRDGKTRVGKGFGYILFEVIEISGKVLSHCILTFRNCFCLNLYFGHCTVSI
jgi:nucleolar protein 12